MILKKPFSLSIENLFIYIAASIVTFFLLSIIAAELNLYYLIDIVWFLPLAYSSFALFVFFLLFNKVKLQITRIDLLAILITLIFCIVNIFFFHEAFSGGRDDGVY